MLASANATAFVRTDFLVRVFGMKGLFADDTAMGFHEVNIACFHGRSQAILLTFMVWGKWCKCLWYMGLGMFLALPFS